MRACPRHRDVAAADRVDNTDEHDRLPSYDRDTTSTRLMAGCAFSQQARTSSVKLFLIQFRIKVVGADSVSVSSATSLTSTSRNQERNRSGPRRAKRRSPSAPSL